MKRTFVAIAVLILASAALVSCGSKSSNSSTGSQPNALKSRAFISNPLRPSGAGSFVPVLNIMDASLDQLSFAVVNLLGSSDSPNFMVLTPNKLITLVYSNSDNSVSAVDNASAAAASGTSKITLPGPTESIVVGPDNSTTYAAVPTAPVTNGSPGAVDVFALSQTSIGATIPIPGAQFIVGSHNGNRLLVFGGDPSTVTVITPSALATSTDPRIPVTGFDHPVWGLFSSDDTTAYILDCGPECGGTTAGITILDMNSNTAGITIPLPGATMALMNGSTLYVAGTPPGTACGSGTAATACGTLSVVDTGSNTVTNTAPIIITDGYHNRIELGANGQLFVGSHTCTNINISGGETRGCLSIVDTIKSSVVFPPDNGDVTGIAPIANRSVVYLCEGGNFRVYDTTTDQLLVFTGSYVVPVVIGQAIDVKQID